MRVLILYHTKTGHTLEAANATAEGIRAAGSTVDLVAVGDFDTAKVKGYDALIVGSPCWWGSVATGIPAPIRETLDDLASGALQGKRCGAISVAAFAGAEKVVAGIGAILARKGCDDLRTGPTARAGLPLSLAKGPSVSANDQERFRAFGTSFVA